MIDDPKPNLDLLRRVLQQIDDHPDTWNQDCYARKTACGTQFCIAGHAAVMSGFKVKFAEKSDFADNYEEIPAIAREALGLTGSESNALFCPVYGREDIQRIAHEIAARAGEKL